MHDKTYENLARKKDANCDNGPVQDRSASVAN